MAAERGSAATLRSVLGHVPTPVTVITSLCMGRVVSLGLDDTAKTPLVFHGGRFCSVVEDLIGA